MKTTWLAAVLALCSLAASAEERDSLDLMGWPKDAFTMEPVIDSTLAELMTPDSTVIATAVPYWNSHYRPNSFFVMRVGFRSGEYLLRLTHPRYQTTVKRFRIKVGRHDDTYLIGPVRMRRRPAGHTLGETVVTATKIKFYTRGDTLIFNADAFNLAEGSMLDALVGQLPGAELKRDGRIFMNGRMVESVLLNGRDFFRGDHTVLLDNLPAYTVKHVKFYDKRSERSEALKLDLDDARFVMDVQLKREYQVGWLANAEAGGGTHGRWLARLFALRFTPQSRLTCYANANNVREDRKPGRDGQWSPASLEAGTGVTASGGFDYLVNDKHHRWELEGNLQAVRAGLDTETRQSRERYQGQGSVFGRSRQTDGLQRVSVRTGHKFRFMLGPENDRYRTQLYLKPRFSYSHSRNTAESLSAEFSARPVGEGGWESLFGSGPEAGRALAGLLVNTVRTRRRSLSDNWNGGADAQLYFKIPFSGRQMELTAGVQGSRRQAHSFDLYTLSYADAPDADRRHRYFDTPSGSLEARARLSWGYTLLSEGFHSFVLNPDVGYVYVHGRQENSLYRLDLLEEMTGFDVLPSTRDALLDVLDRPNSYLTVSDRHEIRATLSFCYDYDVRETVGHDRVRTALWRVRLQPGVTLGAERLGYEGARALSPRRTRWLPVMTLSAQRNTPGMKHQIKLEGSYRQQLPSLFTLMGLRFDSDPLNLSEGNAGLRRTEVFSAVLDYWGQRHGRLFGKVTATFYRNAVATAQTYDAATGVRTFRPQNVDGNYNIQAFGLVQTPLGRRRRFSLSIRLDDAFYRSVDLLGAAGSSVPVRSTVYTNCLSLPLGVEYNHGKLRVGAKCQAAWHLARSRRENFRDISGASLDAGVYGNVRLPWDFQLATDLTWYARRGYAGTAMNADNLVWNAQLSKSVLHGRLTFILVGYDILGDLSHLTYTVDTQGVTETWRNVIPRYGMLRVIWKLNRPPGKRQ